MPYRYSICKRRVSAVKCFEMIVLERHVSLRFLVFFFSLSVLSQDKCHLSSKLMYSTVLLLERGLVGWKEVCVVALALG